jgi:Tfp pilus assembly protein FimT
VFSTANRGATLLELLVALLLLEIAGVLALQAALTLGRIHRRSHTAAATDFARATAVARGLADPTCRSSPVPWAAPVLLPAAAGRPAQLVLVRCGR